MAVCFDDLNSNMCENKALWCGVTPARRFPG
jgi:hypothetical protein